jgi:putative ABC transport system substrate-binding protein
MWGRREFITLLGGAAAVFFPARPLRVQQAARPAPGDRVHRIGIVIPELDSDQDRQADVAAFREVLVKLGWMVRRNLQIDYAWGASNPERARAATADILSLSPNVILASSTLVLSAVQRATRTVPVVFTVVSEPVMQGFVASLARPGGNITGFTNLEPSVGAKWLELLKELAPLVTHVAIMFNPRTTPIAEAFARSAEAAAADFAVRAIIAPVHDTSEIEATMTMFYRKPGGGLILAPDSFTNSNRRLIIDLAAQYRVPAICWTRSFVDDGGLASYGIDTSDLFRRAATYVDRILRGEKAAELPVQQPTKFALVINLKTVRALGLDLSARTLMRSDEVVE